MGVFATGFDPPRPCKTPSKVASGPFAVSSSRIPCFDAADINDDNRVNLPDASYLLNWLFLGTSDPKAPFPKCGFDFTDDCLSCKKRGVQSHTIPPMPCTDTHSHD